MARDGEGRVRASIERGGPQAPAAGRRRVFEAERTCKLALAHEGKAACDVKIHLTLDTAGDDGAAWRDRRTYTGAKAAGGLGLLQSHLQKCIRRGNVDLAVRSAHELAGITFGPTDPAGVKMFRCPPVIAVEDSAALPCVLPAVWYMMALSPTEKSPATYKTDGGRRPRPVRVRRAARGAREPRPPPAAAQGPQRAADEQHQPRAADTRRVRWYEGRRRHAQGARARRRRTRRAVRGSRPSPRRPSCARATGCSRASTTTRRAARSSAACARRR